MIYLVIIIEIVVTTLLIFIQYRAYTAFTKRLNPNGHPLEHHNLVKTGKTKRLKAARTKFTNRLVLLIAVGLTAVALTMFLNANEIVKQHREDGTLTNPI